MLPTSFPTVSTMKSSLVAALTAVSIAAVPAAPALAWGDKEQGFLAGVATAVIIDELLKNSRRAHLYNRGKTTAPIYFQPAPVTVQPNTSIYRTPAARAFQSYTPSERKAIQQKLRAWGYYRGGIDGAFGPGTYNAVIAYAGDEGLTARLAETTSAFGVYDSLLY